MERHILGMLNQTWIWRILRPDWNCSFFVMFSKLLPEQLYCCATGGPLSSLCVGAMGVCLINKGVWQMACVNWHPHERQDPRFPSRILRCWEMISAIHLSCEWFQCCGFLLYIAVLTLTFWLWRDAKNIMWLSERDSSQLWQLLCLVLWHSLTICVPVSLSLGGDRMQLYPCWVTVTNMPLIFKAA